MAQTDYTIYLGAVLEHESYLTVMRGPTPYSIMVCHTRIERTRFGKAYSQMVKVPWEDRRVKPFDLVCSQVLHTL